MLEEILMAFARRTQNIGAPHKHVARPVQGVIWVFAAHLETAVFERFDGVRFGIHALGLGILDHLHRVGLQLRCTGQPAHAFSTHVVVDHAAAELGLVCQGRQNLLHTKSFITPLVGVRVEKAGAVHLAGWTHPIQGERQGGPASLWT